MLVMGMTVTSAFLLALEPGRVAPLSGATLSSLDQRMDPSQRLVNVDAPLHNWKAIYIFDSLSLEGSAGSLNRSHVQMGLDGLASHFVLGNGRGAPDGATEIGFRWQRQFPGQFLEGQGAAWYNQNAIGICVIGNLDVQPLTQAQMRELVWLVRQLQQQFDIPRDQVIVRMGTAADGLAARFPYAAFEQQILR